MVTFFGSENQSFFQKWASSTSQFREHRDPIYCTQNISLYFCLENGDQNKKNRKFAVFVGSISFIQSLCVNFKLMATAVLVVGRFVYVTMSDTVGPEFYSKTVNRTIRGSAVAISRTETESHNVHNSCIEVFHNYLLTSRSSQNVAQFLKNGGIHL